MRIKKTLRADDWIEAAFRALTIEGPQGIRAERIARDLKVSKGSFYWHFKDVAALKAAMLKQWQAGATRAVILRIDESDAPAQDQLKLLVLAATGKDNTPYGGVLVEAAIRDWARYDKAVSKIVQKIDKQRLGYLEKLFLKIRNNQKQAKQNASILYAALIGLESLSARGLADLQKDLLHLLEILIEGE